jgi:hypothetical protein
LELALDQPCRSKLSADAASAPAWAKVKTDRPHSKAAPTRDDASDDDRIGRPAYRPIPGGLAWHVAIQLERASELEGHPRHRAASLETAVSDHPRIPDRKSTNRLPFSGERSVVDAHEKRIDEPHEDQPGPSDLMCATAPMQYDQLWVNHGFSDLGQAAEHIGVFNGNEISPKSAQRVNASCQII